MSHPSSFYITTPIYYVNDVPHIGHAYTTVVADVLARYWRLRGRDVFFLTGLDEHGQKVQQAATKAGIDPQAYCNSMVPRFRNLWERLNISNDAFIRTTDLKHKDFVRERLNSLSGETHRFDYEGWYCTFDERFWTEKDVTDGLCPECKRPVEQLTETNYFFMMGEYQRRLIESIKSSSGRPPRLVIQPESRRNEVIGFLTKQKLAPLCISRPKSRLSWGIEFPDDPKYVTYVWFDALLNYISALEYLNPDPKNKYWPSRGDSEHEVLHLIGKDILTAHAVYWPTMLMAMGIELPTKIFAHGWWTVNGEKMSKSRGNVVDPNKMIDEFGADAFRYFLLREVPFGQDGDFSQEAMITRINSDLANGLGNLLSRTLTMIDRFSEGKIPGRGSYPHESLEKTIIEAEGDLSAISNGLTADLRFKEHLESIWVIVSFCDELIEEAKPWNLAKTPEARPRLNNVLNTLARTLRFLSIFTYPYMPGIATEISRQLGLNFDFTKPLLAEGYALEDIVPATRIQKGGALFPRIESKPQGAKTVSDTPTSPQPTAAAPQTPAPAAPAPAAPTQITFDEFMKIQLKTAKVLSAERVPKSEKLLKLQVSLGEGTEPRQVVAGIGKKYEPEALIGKTIILVANLKPAKLMGIESQGMVLAAGDSEVCGLATILEEVDPGTKVK